MRKTALYGILLAAALLVPTKTTELGKLKPVEAVSIRVEGDSVIIKTDTEDMGKGTTVPKALVNLKETSDGIIFLDTADYLLVTQGAETHIPELTNYLKQGVRMCGAEENVDLKDAVGYLSTHKPEVKLKYWNVNTKLQKLKKDNERLILE